MDVDALDKLREAIRDDLAGWPIGNGYYSTDIGTDDAGELADFLLAGSLEPLLAEVRRGRALRDNVRELCDSAADGYVPVTWLRDLLDPS